MVAAALIAAVLAYHSFLDKFVNFLDVVIFIFFPWSAINLADFYLVRHGHYDIPALFDRDGIYGKIQGPTAAGYVIGIVVELLVVNQTYFTGPLVQDIGGVDISWIPGFVIPFVAYVGLMKGRPAPGNAVAPVSSAASVSIQP